MCLGGPLGGPPLILGEGPPRAGGYPPPRVVLFLNRSNTAKACCSSGVMSCKRWGLEGVWVMSKKGWRIRVE